MVGVRSRRITDGRLRFASLLVATALLVPALVSGCSSNPTVTATNPVPLISTDELPAAAPGEIHLFSINDLHGNLEPPKGANGVISGYTAGGAEYLAAHLARLRTAYPANAVLSAGDNIGASPLVSSLFHDEPTIDLLNSVGVAASSVGNHEFDHGVAELGRIQHGGCAPDGCNPGATFTGAHFPYLAANVTDANGQPPADLPPWTMLHVGGHKIGVIGVVTPDTAHIVIPEGIRGYTFGDEIDAVNKYVPAVQAAGAQTIVVVMHDGGVQRPAAGVPLDYNGCANITPEVTDFATKIDPAVSVLLTAHTHQPYVCTIAGKVVTQASSYGRLITDVTMQFDAAGHVHASAVNRVVTRDIAPDPTTARVVNFFADQAKPRAAKPVGALLSALSNKPFDAGDSPMGDILADSMLKAAARPEAGGAVAAFMNAGGVRADLVSPHVTFNDIHTVAPFGNQVVTVSLTGQQILALLEQQWHSVSHEAAVMSVAGIEYAYNDAAPSGHKIIAESVHIAGQPLDLVARYRIATNNFLASGGDGFTVFTQSTDHVIGPVDLEALEAYFRDATPVAPPSSRITKR